MLKKPIALVDLEFAILCRQPSSNVTNWFRGKWDGLDTRNVKGEESVLEKV